MKVFNKRKIRKCKTDYVSGTHCFDIKTLTLKLFLYNVGTSEFLKN